MERIDKAILDTNKVICDNIKALGLYDHGLLSQNILAQLRNFIEYVAIKIYKPDEDVNPSDYDIHKDAMKFIGSRDEFGFIYEFHHEMLQKSVSHYTLGTDGSERLMLKYYDKLLRIRSLLKNSYDLDVLENIEDFPLNNDSELVEYYEKIADIIENPSSSSTLVIYKGRYYVYRISPFIANHQVYYEVTFSTANDNLSKFDRVTAFTKHSIIDNYAVRFSIHSDVVDIYNQQVSILIIDSYDIAIRPCEWNRLSLILGVHKNYDTNSTEYRKLMEILKTIEMSLTDLVCSDPDYYDSIKNEIIGEKQRGVLFDLLDKSREIIVSNCAGSNVLRYLLYKMNNRVLKLQYSEEPCSKLSGLYLSYRCIPFDNMPFCTSLIHHNPVVNDLIEAISPLNRDHEFLARFITNNSENKGFLFTSKDTISDFENVDQLIQRYNDCLHGRQSGRRIEEFQDHIYMRKYVDDCTTIVRKLIDMSTTGVSHYTDSVDSWISNNRISFDDPNKLQILRNMFADSRVAVVYGSAGTGKSTLLNYVSEFWADSDKKFIATTHSAVENMRVKIKENPGNFSTIASFINNDTVLCDILFIDECGVVSNSDMVKILDTASFDLLVLTGDTYQIESINFGNWFSIIPYFLPKSSVFELPDSFRASNNELNKLWKQVRDLTSSILEHLVNFDFVSSLDQSLYDQHEEDEIILCYQYDGLYGINNINKFMQNANPNLKVEWGLNSYKVGDPILFNENSKFSPLIHNNSKGRIVSIKPSNNSIQFDIELDKTISCEDAEDYDFSLVGDSPNGNSIISFSVNKYMDIDENDDDDDSTEVPFQVAYAVSIHKAQGLEYDSVKIIITKESQVHITHNIFYTAITRARKKLKIYWSPETEREVLERLSLHKPSKKDAYLLSALSSIPMS